VSRITNHPGLTHQKWGKKRTEKINMEDQLRIVLLMIMKKLNDPRATGRSIHPLIEVVMIAICAVVCWSKELP
jgi:hypothetical protein